MTELAFDERTLATLQRYGFDLPTFRSLQNRVREGTATQDHNRIRGRVEVPREGDVASFPTRGSEARAALEARGSEAIAAGRVGAVVLAGGMATRFGGEVKASVEALPGHTFLELKLCDLSNAAERAGVDALPVALMTSFATDEAVRAMVREVAAPRLAVECFAQSIAVRLTPSGDVFHEDSGEPSLYAPGHGDLTSSLRRSGVLGRFRERGGEVLFMSNVDNLGATLDAGIIGAHLESGAEVTVECAEKEPGDKGGAPARVDGKLQIVESFRFPEGFDQDRIPVFNTNTLVLDAAAIDRDFDLTWFAVTKEVDGRPAVQLERLVGELTAFLEAAFLRVDRTGPDGRFLPVKDPAELAKRQPDIREALTARGVL
jgi:UTP--glucose-1-phosphate uridylyltransferase